MKAWLLLHAKTIATVALLVAAYALSKHPQFQAEHDLIVAIGFACGLFGTAFTPGFLKSPEPKE